MVHALVPSVSNVRGKGVRSPLALACDREVSCSPLPKALLTCLPHDARRRIMNAEWVSDRILGLKEIALVVKLQQDVGLCRSVFRIAS
jgi:hypothetical protein